MFPMPNADAHLLHGLKILIVEDDMELANDIVEVLTPLTGQVPTVAGCIETALEFLSDKAQYQLAILDVMLPRKKEDSTKIQEFEQQLRSFRSEISDLERREKETVAQDRLREIRHERATVIKRIDDLIDPKGGITLIEQWKLSHLDHPWRLPTVFLTAVSNNAIKRSAKLVAGENCEWLVKPVSSRILIETCEELRTQAAQDT
jgi:CheY-like chemotaxis protein